MIQVQNMKLDKPDLGVVFLNSWGHIAHHPAKCSCNPFPWVELAVARFGCATFLRVALLGFGVQVSYERPLSHEEAREIHEVLCTGENCEGFDEELRKFGVEK